MTAETVRIDQAAETPVKARQRARFGYRYAYARSADSRASGDPGQDYLTLREDGVRLAFALCDGVSQSFYGDLAARLLGDALVDWLWEGHFTDSGAFREGLAAFLDGLVETASAQVAAHPLPEGLPEMLRQVLEEKRALGSETTFVAGLLDTDAGVLHLAWMGDSRIRLWGPEGEFTAQLGDTFHTQERWSTRRGRIGELHVFSCPLQDLRYLVAYTDGLARLDKVMRRHFRDASIQAVIDDALLRPESDDIAFLEVWLGDRRPSERPSLAPPPEVRVEPQGKRARVWWQPVAGAAYYEVRLDDGQSFQVYSPRHALELPPEALRPGVRTLRVRAWDEEPGPWSPEAALPDEVLPRPALVETPSPVLQETVPPPSPLASPSEVMPTFLPSPAPAPAPSPPTAGPVPKAPSPAPPGLSLPRPAARPRPSWLAPLLVGITGTALGCSLALFLLLWPPSPLRGLLFPSPTPRATFTPTSTPTPTATFTPTPTSTPTPTATFTPTPTSTPTPTATPTPTPEGTGLPESAISPLPTPAASPASPEATEPTPFPSPTPTATFTPTTPPP